MSASRDQPPGRLRIWYVCYLGIDDPLVETQVVAYVEGLAAAGHEVLLTTFEPRDGRSRRQRREQRERTRARLGGQRIAWRPLPYHKRPSLPATAFDVAVAVAFGCWITCGRRIELIHARSHVPAAIALLLRRLVRKPFIFDIRGLMAEEYEDAGRWTRGSVAFRLTKRVERAAIERAAGLVVLTHAVQRRLFPVAPAAPLEVIPCCVDDRRLRVDRARRAEDRASVGVRDGPLLVYVGKFTGWYMHEEIARFFAAAWRREPDAALLVLTQSEPLIMRRELDRLGVPEDRATMFRAPHDEVARWLSAADIALSFVRPVPSKVASSPTKVGEYLAAGLPVLSTSGIGDSSVLIERERVGVLLHAHDARAHQRAWDEMRRLLDDPALGDRCRRVARDHLSLADVGIPRYRRLYERVAERIAET